MENRKKRDAEYRRRNAKSISEKYKRIYREWKINGKWRKYDLKRYGITPEQYDEILAAQNCCCAICGIEESKLPRRLFVDHDHKTGKVRGLLCSNCNFVLGYSKDDVSVLKNSITYLSINN